MKIVTYTSHTGFTKRYADTLATRLDCLSIQFNKNLVDNIETYDPIIYCGGITAGKINGLKDFLNIHNKDIIVLAVGLSEYSKEYISELKKNNNIKDIPLFYVRGGTDFKKLNIFSRFILRKVTKLEKDVDYFDPNNLNEIIEYIKNNYKKD